jgi:hypothetical protein
MVCSVQTVHLSCVKISTLSRWTKISFRLSLITSEYYQVHLKGFSDPMVCSAQTVHVPCVKIRTTSKLTKTSFHLSLVSSYSIGCIENNSLACGTFVAPVHLSCTYTNTISKWTEMRFEFHPVRPKQFLSLWYVQPNRAPILRQD